MTEFKVGDRVILERPDHAQNAGAIGTVTECNQSRRLRVRFDIQSSLDGGHAAAKFDPLDVHPSELPHGHRPALPVDSGERKKFPMFSGLLAYFPAALAQVSNHSFEGNQKHNPGLPLQHARGISGDHEDCVIRHLVDAKEHAPGSSKRIEELRALAWRSLALLQEECELAGCVPAPAASFDRVPK